MNCQQARDSLGALVSGDIESPPRDDLEAHLRSCSACRAEFEELESVWQELGRLPAYRVPDELKESLESLSSRAGAGSPNSFPAKARLPRRAMLLQAVAALLLLASGIAIGYRLQPAAEAEKSAGSAAGQMSRYLLLLRATETSELSDSRQEQLVLEYASWYRSLVARGLGLEGERLQKERQLIVRENGGVSLLGPQAFSDGDVAVSGFFLVQAESLAKALEIASTCPHLRVGAIEVRALYPE